MPDQQQLKLRLDLLTSQLVRIAESLGWVLVTSTVGQDKATVTFEYTIPKSEVEASR